MKTPWILMLLLVSSVAFANPFVGRWVCDADRYQISDTHITGIMDGSPYDSDYNYTAAVVTWKDRVWIYHVFHDPDRILMVSITIDTSQPTWWLLRRIPDDSPPGT